MLPAIDIFKERFGSLRFFLAPMAGITDTVFRLLMRSLGAQTVISELVSAEGIVRGGAKTLDLLQFDEAERPVGIQLFGSSQSTLVEAARRVADLGVDFVDVNFGCPVRKIVCDGGGAAWLKSPASMRSLLSEMKNVLRIPLTIKVRTGWDETNLSLSEVVRAAADAGVAWVAVHGRTRAQGYSGAADWELIRRVAIQSPIPIIGNGDITTAEQATRRLAEGYAHAVMIGRGALKNPWIFQEALCMNPERNFLKLVDRHFDLAIEKKDRRRAFLSLKKFLAWYATGYPNCSRFRGQVFSTEDIDGLRHLAAEYFGSLDPARWINDQQPFLMGGHG